MSIHWSVDYNVSFGARFGQEGVMNSPLGWFEVSGHRDVTTSKAREFAEPSKMVLATMLEFGLQTYFLCY